MKSFLKNIFTSNKSSHLKEAFEKLIQSSLTRNANTIILGIPKGCTVKRITNKELLEDDLNCDITAEDVNKFTIYSIWYNPDNQWEQISGLPMEIVPEYLKVIYNYANDKSKYPMDLEIKIDNQIVEATLSINDQIYYEIKIKNKLESPV